MFTGEMDHRDYTVDSSGDVRGPGRNGPCADTYPSWVRG